MNPAALTVGAFMLYVCAAVAYGAVLFLQAPSAPAGTFALAQPHPLSRYGRPLLFAGTVLQFFAIGAWCVTTHRSPFASAFGTLSVTAWAIALAFGFLDLRRSMPAVGAIALTVACVVLFAGILNARSPVAQAPILAGQLVSLHVLATLVSFGLFLVSCICAILYLHTHRRLKRHQAGGLFHRLPPLETLDRTAYRAVAFALPLLTLGLALGFIRAFGDGTHHPPNIWLFDPHTITAVFAWLVYLAYFAARLIFGWHGNRLQYLLILGMGVAFSLFFMPTLTHHFV